MQAEKKKGLGKQTNTTHLKYIYGPISLKEEDLLVHNNKKQVSRFKGRLFLMYRCHWHCQYVVALAHWHCHGSTK